MIESRADLDAALINEQLARILASKTFAGSRRSQDFLRYVVETAQTPAASAPKEFAIAAEVFGRGATYDPAIDATVRVEAGRLRNRLREYYDTDGTEDPILIGIPKGRYTPVFTLRSPAVPVLAAPAPSPLSSPGLTHRSTAEPAPAAPTSAPHRRLLRPLTAAWLAASVVAISMAGWVLYRRHAGAVPPIHSVAVLPLKNLSPDIGMEFFADGMTDELTTDLALLPQLRVVSHTSAVQEHETHDSLREISRKLNVDAVVEGSILRSGNTVRFNIQLIDAREDRHLWAGTFDGPLSNVLELQDQVAREIVAHARVVFPSGTREHPAPTQRIDPGAYDAYLRGQYFLAKREPDKALASFHQSIAIDPNYAAAYSGLAGAFDSVALLGGTPAAEAIPQAISAARHAIELDPQNGEAWSVLGIVASDWQWDWKSAEADLKRAIALSPNDSLAAMRYATYLISVGKRDESVQQMKRALDLDPLSFWNNRQMGTVLYFAHRYDEALYYLHLAAEMEPTRNNVTQNWISLVYTMQGQDDLAVHSDYSMMTRLPPALQQRLLSAYQSAGAKGYWREKLALLQPSSNDCNGFAFAAGYARVHDTNQTLLALNRAIDQRCFLSGSIAANPLFDNLHSDPRFADLLHRVGLPLT